MTYATNIQLRPLGLLERAITSYQIINRGERYIPTDKHIRTGMQILTGQDSTSEWTRREMIRAAETYGSLDKAIAAAGVAMKFISKAWFEVAEASDDGGQLAVYEPSLPKGTGITYAQNHTHVNVSQVTGCMAPVVFLDGLVCLTASVAEFYAGRMHRSISGLADSLIYFAQPKQPKVVKEGTEGGLFGWGGTKYRIVEDKPAKVEKDSWGNERKTPAVTHKQVEFKGNFYSAGTVEKPKTGW